MKFITYIKEIGKSVSELFEMTGSYIIFSDMADETLKEICLIHSGIDLKSDIEVGDTLNFLGKTYSIINVGEEVNNTIRTLGHCTLMFGKDENYQNLPGQIVLKEECDGDSVEIGMEISIN